MKFKDAGGNVLKAAGDVLGQSPTVQLVPGGMPGTENAGSGASVLVRLHGQERRVPIPGLEEAVRALAEDVAKAAAASAAGIGGPAAADSKTKKGA
jgi:hypothetical protein